MANDAPAAKQIAPIVQVRQTIEAMAPQFKAALPAQVSVDKFIRVTLTALQMNPSLVDLDRRSLFGAVTRAAQDGLLPDGREGAIVAYGNNAQWMPMVAGIMKKVRNSGEIGAWSVQVVHENDVFEYQLGDEEKIVHRPAMKDRGALVGAYSIVSLKGGEKSREFMSLEEIEGIRKRSRSAGKGPWVTDFAEMCKKTVIRRHSKRLPMSTDLDEFIRQDDDLDVAPVATVQQEAIAPPTAPSTRPRRLQAVAAAAPAEQPVIEGEVMADDDSPI